MVEFLKEYCAFSAASPKVLKVAPIQILHSLIGSIFCYFFYRKVRVFPLFVFLVFSVFCFETVCFGCFASIPKQSFDGSIEQKTHPNILKEGIFGYFSENLGVVSVCYETYRFVSVVSI